MLNRLKNKYKINFDITAKGYKIFSVNLIEAVI